MAEALTVGLSALAGLVSGFLGAIGKSYIDRRAKIDEGLRAKRAEVYGELWKLTSILPRYPRNEGLTYEQLAKQSTSLRDWYFQASGGLYLSRDSQKSYMEFQHTITALVAAHEGEPSGTPMSRLDYDRAMTAGSRLRSSLTDDLHSRSEARAF